MISINPILFFLLGLTLVHAEPKSQSKAGKVAAPKKSLDTTQIHKQYVEGDFDDAIDQLEIGLKYVSPLSHEDSVFIFKHLGVMYTAKYETREKGKQFMMRLLDVEPSARLMDMYASDMIYMIFKNIQDEYEMAKAKLRKTQDLQEGNSKQEIAAKDKSNMDSEKQTKSSYKWVSWTVGAIAVAGGAVLAVSLLDEEEPGTKENVVQWNQ